APKRVDEIAFAPTTMKALNVRVGDTVKVGSDSHRVRVVGEALLPATSHTDYDQSGWMTKAGLYANAKAVGPADFEDYVFFRYAPSANRAATDRHLTALANKIGLDSEPATLPTTVVDLGRLRSLPLALAVFFAFLAIATVAHA